MKKTRFVQQVSEDNPYAEIPKKQWLSKDDYEDYREQFLPPDCYTVFKTNKRPTSDVDQLTIEVCTFEGMGLEDVKRGEANALVVVSLHDLKKDRHAFLDIIEPWI